MCDLYDGDVRNRASFCDDCSSHELVTARAAFRARCSRVCFTPRRTLRMLERHVDVDVPIRCVVQGRPPFNTVMAEPSAFMRVSIVRVGRARPTRSRHGAVSRAEASKHIDLSAAEPTLVPSACRDSPPTKGQSPWVLWQRVRCRSALGNGPASRGVTRRVLAGVGAVRSTPVA